MLRYMYYRISNKSNLYEIQEYHTLCILVPPFSWKWLLLFINQILTITVRDPCWVRGIPDIHTEVLAKDRYFFFLFLEIGGPPFSTMGNPEKFLQTRSSVQQKANTKGLLYKHNKRKIPLGDEAHRKGAPSNAPTHKTSPNKALTATAWSKQKNHISINVHI